MNALATEKKEFELFTREEGKWLVSLSRKAARLYLESGTRLHPPADTPQKMMVNHGAFVTLRTFPEGELRGCIGRPDPAMPLVQAVIDSAIDSASHDPRFDPLPASSLEKCTFEVSVLTRPTLLKVVNPLEYKKAVVVGRDGLIVEWDQGAGLLLPQVPVEENWDVDTYLAYACMKAGAHPDYWLIGNLKLYTFQAEVFAELSPLGEVTKKSLGDRK